MIEDRFKKYIQEIEGNTTCKEFLEINRMLIARITGDKEIIQEYHIHKALSNLKRFTILNVLQHKPMCTCALARIFGVSDGTITHHLKILEAAGLIIGKKEGYFTRYYTKKELIAELT